MKNLFTSRLLAIVCLATVVLAPSCKKDELDREKFLGTYSVSDGCSTSGSATYTIIINASSSDDNKILILNLWDQFSNAVVATVDANSLVISKQEPDGNGLEVVGNGTYNNAGSLISLNYTVSVKNSNQNDVCQATLTKQ